MIKIDKNIPIPGLPPERKKVKYPWEDMQIGDSFFVEGRTGRDFAATAYSVGLRLKMKFSCKSVPGGSRCWRIE